MLKQDLFHLQFVVVQRLELCNSFSTINLGPITIALFFLTSKLHISCNQEDQPRSTHPNSIFILRRVIDAFDMFTFFILLRSTSTTKSDGSASQLPVALSFLQSIDLLLPSGT